MFKEPASELHGPKHGYILEHRCLAMINVNLTDEMIKNQ